MKATVEGEELLWNKNLPAEHAGQGLESVNVISVTKQLA